MKKTILDDGYHNYLVENTELVGAPGIPMMLDMHNTDIPLDIIPFEKCRHTEDKRKYVHFYMHDRYFSAVLADVDRYLSLLKSFDGVITPDCTMMIGQAPCLQQTSTYFNRAIGVYLQHHGLAVIPNIRWSDESSFEYCFLGVPKNMIVCVSTHGCIRTAREKKMFRLGLDEMLRVLEPRHVLVHGYMPESVFGDYLGCVNFTRYPSQFERTHSQEVA